MKTEQEMRDELDKKGWVPEVLVYDGVSATKGYVVLFTKGSIFLKGTGPDTWTAIAAIYEQMGRNPFICLECGLATNDYYMVKPSVWRAATPGLSSKRGVFLHYRCLEKRINRLLVPEDFDLELGINSGIVQGLRMAAGQPRLEQLEEVRGDAIDQDRE